MVRVDVEGSVVCFARVSFIWPSRAKHQLGFIVILVCSLQQLILSEVQLQYLFLMGNVPREIARPFQYAAKTGSSETSETGRSSIGGQITGRSSQILVKSVDTISVSNFDGHLRAKGFNDMMVTYFAPLKYTNRGSRQRKQLKFNQTQTAMEIAGVAVSNNGTTIKVAVIWKKALVTFQAPQLVINYVTRHYGMGWRNSDHHSNTIVRGLTDAETKGIMQALSQQAGQHNLALEAENSL